MESSDKELVIISGPNGSGKTTFAKSFLKKHSLKKAEFRFYEELNDFLPATKKKTSFFYEFKGNPSVKDAVEAIGVPHIEVDLILVNSKSVAFTYHIQNGDRVSVYPVFESMDISNVTRLRKKPLRRTKYILDVHLGKLAKYLRMLGFDTLYENYYKDSEIIEIAKAEKRIILTRDIQILKNKAVTHGYYIRSQHPKRQLKEVILRFSLNSNIKLLARCIACNGQIKKTTKESVINKLEPKTKKYYDDFYQCSLCKKVYWKGSHYYKIKNFADNFRQINLT